MGRTAKRAGRRAGHDPVRADATERPRPCPLAPGVFPRLADVGAALEPLLFESGYLAAPYPKLFNAAALRQAGVRFNEALAVNEDVLFNLDFLFFRK